MFIEKSPKKEEAFIRSITIFQRNSYQYILFKEGQFSIIANVTKVLYINLLGKIFKIIKVVLVFRSFIFQFIYPAGKIAEKAVWRSVFWTIWHCILSANSTKTHSSDVFAGWVPITLYLLA